MKAFLFLLLMVSSTSLWAACPDLTGTWLCKTNDMEKTTYSQTVANGVTTYKIGRYEIPADGKTAVSLGDLNGIGLCTDDDAFVVRSINGGAGNMEMIQKMSKDAAGNRMMTLQMVLIAPSGERQMSPVIDCPATN